MIVLVVGGARSGKSALGERLAGRLPEPVTYFATMVVGDDPDLAARVERHRKRRSAAWSTVEVGAELPDALRTTVGTALVDSLGPWLASQPGMVVDRDSVCRALVDRQGDTVLVSEEVGWGVHPSTSAGRRFRDELGSLNQAVAAVADAAYLSVAGRVVQLETIEGL
jgi:adenosyl cobinamide kinase/adenosyl cobinamide phosphate guanylyltransferase